MSYKIKDTNIIISNNKAYKIPRVKDLPDDEKPREKLISNGVSALSLPELLAIVLGTGTKKEEVFSMSSRLLREYGEKGIVHQKDPESMHKDLDIPITKACQIVACFELGKRLYQKNPGGLTTIRNASQAFEHLKDMGGLKKEQFRGLYLNDRHQIIYEEVVSIGTINTSLVHPREVFRPALEYSAAAIIIAHNHPSGSTKATKADVEVTDKLISAGKILGIEVLDHLIITKNKFKSII